MTFRSLYIRIIPSYSRYWRQMMVWACAVLNFNSLRMLPFSERDVCPSDALLSGVTSKSSVKYPFMNMSCVIWRPVFEWWLSEPTKDCRSLSVAGIPRQTQERDLFSVYVHHKMGQTEMTKDVRFFLPASFWFASLWIVIRTISLAFEFCKAHWNTSSHCLGNVISGRC